MDGRDTTPLAAASTQQQGYAHQVIHMNQSVYLVRQYIHGTKARQACILKLRFAVSRLCHCARRVDRTETSFIPGSPVPLRNFMTKRRGRRQEKDI